ncbi:MAG TPA: hypothetical protein VK835_00765 [Bacteroidia bacterium]|nr:hypothetical protein [Bacteroidia bacterium]
MKNTSLIILLAAICFLQACNEQPATRWMASIKPIEPVTANNSLVTTYYSKAYIPLEEYNNSKGFFEEGNLMTNFDCPDAHRDFPPVNIKQWDKVPVVNGRFPSYEETKTGKALHHYGEKPNANIKPYNMLLPKLATYYNSYMKTNELVIVIQIAQSAKDTVVSFRYVTGGCGGNTFSHFHFLTDDEVKKVTQ